MNRADSIGFDFARRDRSRLENALRAAGVESFRGKCCKCPYHDDKSPSGSLFEKDGVWKFHCFVCKLTLDVFDVEAKTAGKPVNDFLSEMAKMHNSANGNGQNGKPKEVFPTPEKWAARFRDLEAIYQYTDPMTRRVQMLVARYVPPGGRKKFAQGQPNGSGFIDGKPEGKVPLYNRTRLMTCDNPVLVEGEKKVHALADIGIVATCFPGGANNAANTDYSPLDGKTSVVIWRDNDAPGLAMQEEVMRQIEQLRNPPSVRTVDPAMHEIEEGGDVVDFIKIWGEGDREASRAAVQMVIDTATGAGPGSEINALIEDTISGRRSSLPWKWPSVSLSTQALLPGTITVICGDPESGKSFLGSESFWTWHESGIPVAIYEMEDDRAFHLLRAAAQMSGESRLTDADWVKASPDAARRIMAECNARLDSFGKSIFTCPSDVVKLSELNEWIDAQCAAGKKVIGIDPVTAAESGQRPWIEDKVFLIRAKASIRQHGARLILFTHPRIGVNVKPGLAGLSGGAAYSRFCHTAMWLIKHPRPKRVKVSTPLGLQVVAINRTLRIAKARNARGGGLDLGFFFRSRHPAPCRAGNRERRR